MRLDVWMFHPPIWLQHPESWMLAQLLPKKYLFGALFFSTTSRSTSKLTSFGHPTICTMSTVCSCFKLKQRSTFFTNIHQHIQHPTGTIPQTSAYIIHACPSPATSKLLRPVVSPMCCNLQAPPSKQNPMPLNIWAA